MRVNPYDADYKLMVRIAEYVGKVAGCSIGEVAMNLSIKGWKQRELARDYGEFFPQLKLDRGYWQLRHLTSEEWAAAPTPKRIQDVLSAKGD